MHKYMLLHSWAKDILVIGDKVSRIADKLKATSLPEVEVFDLKVKGCSVTLIYVHITGGGGEQGPASRVPNLPECIHH